tara:strand:- start:215 stop:460 length:246 start_codon:yes stop_codon:yes gene_type:complete
MKLRCKKCGSRRTKVLPKKQLEKMAQKEGITIINEGLLPKEVIKDIWKIVITTILYYIKKIIDSSETLYVVCKKCGTYRKL